MERTNNLERDLIKRHGSYFLADDGVIILFKEMVAQSGRATTINLIYPFCIIPTHHGTNLEENDDYCNFG
jgi:hypothetical protein